MNTDNKPTLKGATCHEKLYCKQKNKSINK